MRKFIINVNGNSYEVEVEEVKDGVIAAPVPVQRPSVQSAAPAPVQKNDPIPAPSKAPTEEPKAAANVPAGGVKIASPMPGNIWDIKVNTGDIIKKGDVVLILEAMKMENEIMAPKDGRIVSVNVTKGATVNSGDVLVVME